MALLQTRMQHYAQLVRAARGEIAVDMAVQGGRILNVLSGEILLCHP